MSISSRAFPIVRCAVIGGIASLILMWSGANPISASVFGGITGFGINVLIDTATGRK